MRDLELGRVARALRRRRGWRQEDAALRAGLHRSSWSNLERGQIGQMRVETVRGCLAVLGVRLDLVPRGRGADLERLLDEGHSALAATWSARLRRWGWVVEPEVSFNHYGDRGRVDLLGWHAAAGTVLVVEVKTELADVQALLGGLDVKVRSSARIAADRGWGRPQRVVPAIVLAESATNRRRLSRVEPLFHRFDLRGRAGLTWLREPRGPAGGVVVFSVQSPATASRVRAGAAGRIRVPEPRASVAAGSRGGLNGRSSRLTRPRVEADCSAEAVGR